VTSYPKPKTPRRPAYLAWLRTQRCAAPMCRSESPPSQASHHGLHGVGIKPSDEEAIPLCAFCHRRWHDFGVIPGAPGEREARRAWMRAVGRQHWREFRRERSATLARRRVWRGEERRA
jgi:hypothetical protein